ncbi:hypothetical protein V8C43DRAFT_100248 [Trichoderma afarasin]
MILTCHVSIPTSSWPVSFDATKCLLADSHPVISFFPHASRLCMDSHKQKYSPGKLDRKNYGLHTRPHLDGRAQAGPRSLHPSFNVPKRTGHVQDSRLVPLHRVTSFQPFLLFVFFFPPAYPLSRSIFSSPGLPGPSVAAAPCFWKRA